MGLLVSLPAETIGRKYRVLTKDELTYSIYTLCKNTIAKWCFPSRNPDQVTQKEVNEFLNNADFNSKKFRVNYPDLKRSFEIPYDFYLRSMYRYAEVLETSLVTNMDKLLFEKVIGDLYGDDASCISRLNITKTGNDYRYTFNNTISTNFKDGNETEFMESVLSIYSKCRYGAMIVSSNEIGREGAHRTLIYIENINNVLNIFYYDPHGSSSLSWSSKLKIFDNLSVLFTEYSEPYLSKFGIKSIFVNEFEKICLLGIQAYSVKYDIGMCQIFSSLWLYNVLKVIAESAKSNVQLPSTDKWIYLIDDYYISQFDSKQRYNAILLFISILFNLYVENNPSYKEELDRYNKVYLLGKTEINNYEVPYESKSEEDIREMQKYIIKVAREAIKASREEEKMIEKRMKQGFIASSLLPTQVTKKRTFKQIKVEEPPEETYEQYRKRIKPEQKEEEEYFKSFRSKIPFGRKKKIFDECKENSDCLSGCCIENELEGGKYCSNKSSCSK
jgi:hypothetical protein